MAKQINVSVGGVVKKVKKVPLGIGGVVKEAKKGVCGVGGVVREFFASSIITSVTKTSTTTVNVNDTYDNAKALSVKTGGSSYENAIYLYGDFSNKVIGFSGYAVSHMAMFSTLNSDGAIKSTNVANIPNDTYVTRSETLEDEVFGLKVYQSKGSSGSKFYLTSLTIDGEEYLEDLCSRTW